MNKNQNSNQNSHGTFTDQKKNAANQNSGQDSSKKSPTVQVEDEFETDEPTGNEKEHHDKDHQHDFKTPVGASKTPKANSGNISLGKQGFKNDGNQHSDKNN